MNGTILFKHLGYFAKLTDKTLHGMPDLLPIGKLEKFSLPLLHENHIIEIAKRNQPRSSALSIWNR